MPLDPCIGSSAMRSNQMTVRQLFSGGLLLCYQLRPDSLFLLLQLGREFGSEIRCLEDRTNLDFRIFTAIKWGCGIRRTHSTASSIDLTCQIQNPAMSSFVSANGPSMTVRCDPEKRTRFAFHRRMKPVAREHNPRFHEFLVEGAHLRRASPPWALRQLPYPCLP
jgi:hypothetical protein